MSRLRDEQRARLYRAEHLAPRGRTFATIHETRAYVDSVTNSALWRQIAGRASLTLALQGIEVHDGRGRVRAGSYTGRLAITLPRAMRFERCVLHELAHQATDLAYSTVHAAHGQHFAHVYVALIGCFMGAEAKRALLESFRAHGVRWHIP